MGDQMRKLLTLVVLSTLSNCSRPSTDADHAASAADAAAASAVKVPHTPTIDPKLNKIALFVKQHIAQTCANHRVYKECKNIKLVCVSDQLLSPN
jgi:hypothetical protein